jgi:hypothetical protein
VLGTRCCPSDLSQAKTAVCGASHQVATANPAPPDGAAEAPEASPEDGALDAPADAPGVSIPDATGSMPDATGSTPDAASSTPDAAGDASADVGADGG